KKKFVATMCLRKELSNVQKGGIIAAKKLGHSNSRISAVVGCSHSFVRHVWKSYELKQLLKKQTGRPRILNEAECKHLKHTSG
ncbi:4953_t:CDS:1, partial [Funneliformis mosseae]